MGAMLKFQYKGALGYTR